MVSRHGDLHAMFKFIGAVRVPDVDYEECTQCGDQWLGMEAGKAWDRAVKAREAELIGALPSRDFVSATEAWTMLDMTRQAFHKNGRIRRGFIYSVPDGPSRRRYSRRSVEQFRETGDGRFRLPGAAEGKGGEGGPGRARVIA